MYTTAVYPGSFDPITNGHMDVIKRASKMYKKLVVAVLVNKSKNSLFTVEERVEMIKESTKNIENVEVDSFSGLLVDYCIQNKIYVSVRGLRALTDFETELQMAHINASLSHNNLETMFFATSTQYSYISSSVIKQIAMFDGPCKDLVPENVETKLKEKFRADSLVNK